MAQTLGKYQIIEELGHGGFGIVYKALDAALNRIVALKVLYPHLTTGDPGFVMQFQREAQLAARLDHPHIVAVYDVGEAEERYYLAMRYVEGRSLDRLLERGVPWPAERILPLAEQIAAALDYAQGQGVLHLDLKPGNILVAGDPQTPATLHAWLADFGLGRAMSSASVPASRPLGGTPAYLAPEQADLEVLRPLTPQTDLYAFGVVLYQLCVGRLPFEGNPVAVAAAHVNQQPPRPTLLNEALNQAIEEVLLRGLAKSPQARYPDAVGLVAALAEALRTAHPRPGLARRLVVPPLTLGDFRVHTLRELAQVCDSTWDAAVTLLYDGGLERWLAQARIAAAAEEAKRIRENRAKAQGQARDQGLEEFLRWTGYVTDPVLSLSPDVLDFGAEEKGFGYHLQALLTVQNAGRGLLWGEVRVLTPWLAVAEGGAFAVRPGERHEVVAEAEVDALPSGVTNTAAAVAVETQVGRGQAGARIEVWGPAPEIAPAELDFGEVAESQEPVHTLLVANRGRGALNGTARSDVSWLVVAPDRFRCTAGRRQALKVRVVAGWLPPIAQKPVGAILLETNEGTKRVAARLVNAATILKVQLPNFELMLIPGGEFLYSDDKRKVTLPEYWIAKTPVTNAQYKVFVAAIGYQPPEHWQGGQIPKGKENHPVVNICWDDAQKFCAWAGVRLPTEQEWEKAARGADGREYPWGAWQHGRCNSKEAGIGGTTPVDRFPSGASPYGCLDMAGNVWEWCADWYDSSQQQRVLRGGSFHFEAQFVRCAFRYYLIPVNRFEHVGFRVASPGL